MSAIDRLRAFVCPGWCQALPDESRECGDCSGGIYIADIDALQEVVEAANIVLYHPDRKFMDVEGRQRLALAAALKKVQS